MNHGMRELIVKIVIQPPSLSLRRNKYDTSCPNPPDHLNRGESGALCKGSELAQFHYCIILNHLYGYKYKAAAAAISN